MTRPTRIPIGAGTQGWDAEMDDNFQALFDEPLPIPRPSVTESNVASTYSASAYEECVVWVNHSVLGYVLYRSDGTNWLPFDPFKRVSRTVTAATVFTSAETASIIYSGGTLPYTHTLPTAASMKGRTLIFKTIVTGTLTIDGNGAETIDGAANITITTQWGVVRLYSDGTSWSTV